MATPNKNAKSQLTTVRVPHDVMELMEEVKQPGESNAGFIVTAMRGEIARRQAEGGSEDPLVSSLDALARVEQIGKKTAVKIGEILDIARSELQRRGIEPKD
ncbi:YlcI/YnfO family protein [Citrobacter koseri]|uniref:YlcI/YnfO family protein n=1 Tax=Citrobacter koseri TaxID=545 RepID=UPI00254B8253|nr:YlcI/YnfO family protein [Citrobacter koseri]MEC5643529.1 YlcI/YnfO family protein [Citrobacter koseri]